MENQWDNRDETNFACVCGSVLNEPVFSHKTYGEEFYQFKIGAKRNSGYTDEIVALASERILKEEKIEIGKKLLIYGQVRTYNMEINGRNRLSIILFAREIEEGEAEVEQNEIYLTGFLCKEPSYRTTPLGRSICDLMVAVNRMYNKSDYIPCIAWGRNAIFAKDFALGTQIKIKGRLQSREYKKKLPDNKVEMRTAYEVSIIQLETLNKLMV